MKTVTKLWIMLAMLVLSVTVSATQQQCNNLKFGFINTVRLYTETKQAKAITEELQQEFAERRLQLAKISTEGLAIQKSLQRGDLLEADKKALEEKLAKLKQRYREAQAQFSEDYALRRNEEFASLQRTANQVISHIKKEDGYDWITDNAVIVDKKFDITDKIIKEMDALQSSK